MSDIYLNSTMLQELNTIVHDYVSKALINSKQDQSTSTLIASTTFFIGLITVIVFYRIVFSSTAIRLKKVQLVMPIPEAVENNWKGKRIKSFEIECPDRPGEIQCHCPATGQLLGYFASQDEEDLNSLINSAATAQIEWAESSFKRRLKVLASLHDFIIKNQHLLARVACRDSGKTLLDASTGEILSTLEKLKWIIEHGEKILSSSKRVGSSNFLLRWYKDAEVHYEPLGVVTAIISWNYPFHNLISCIISALFTGNAIVVKCSEKVVWSSEYFVSLVKKCLVECGEDPELVQLFYSLPLLGDTSSIDYVAAHPSFKHITYIGDAKFGKRVLKAAADALTPVTLELGGKDALIVLDSITNLQNLSSIILRGTFQSAGQNCISIERVIVSEKNYDELTALLYKRLSETPLRLGSDMDHLEDVDMGAIISDKRFDYLESLINEAVLEGATLLVGGSRYQHPNYPQGHYFQPTLLVDVTNEMKISQEETFAPILVVMKAADTAECIKIANTPNFGLGCSIFGNDIDECNKVAKKLKVGNISINDFGTYYVSQLPFGGTHGSGYNKINGEEGLLSLCNAKSICLDAIPYVSTQLPKLLDYPIESNKKAWIFTKNLNTAAYTFSWWTRLKALISLAKNSR